MTAVEYKYRRRNVHTEFLSRVVCISLPLKGTPSSNKRESCRAKQLVSSNRYGRFLVFLLIFRQKYKAASKRAKQLNIARLYETEVHKYIRLLT